MTLYDLLKEKHHRERLKEILVVFSEQGFGFLISRINLSWHLPFKHKIQAFVYKEQKTTLPVRLRLAFEALGPSFIKLGQLLSLRPDLIPQEYIKEFEKMQDKVPANPFSNIKKTIEEELGSPLEKIFSSFEKKPIASASIAQVYKAKLRGKNVAVKVQRPGTKDKFKTDIEIMYKLAELLEKKMPGLRGYYLPQIVHEFERWTIKELNFKVEAHYAQKIAHNFRKSRIIKIPIIFQNYSTEKVLVMEFIEGTPLHDIETLRRKKVNLKKVMQNGFEIFLQQFFIHGLFHADPHAGNILILRDGKIALIDFGIIGNFDDKLKHNTLALFQTVVNDDPEAAAAILLKMSYSKNIDRLAFEEDIKSIFEQFQYTSVKNIHLSYILNEMIALVNKYKIRVPVEFVLFEKTIMTVEGIALRYNPEFNMVNESKDTLKKLLSKRYVAKQILHKTKDKMDEYKELVEMFPGTAKEILQKAKQFSFTIDIDDADIRNLTLEIERSSGNVSLGAIITGLIVASALIMQTSDVTYLYVTGFILAGILSLWLIHRTIFVQIFNKR